jgi:hypothetical protein
MPCGSEQVEGGGICGSWISRTHVISHKARKWEQLDQLKQVAILAPVGTSQALKIFSPTSGTHTQQVVSLSAVLEKQI